MKSRQEKHHLGIIHKTLKQLFNSVEDKTNQLISQGVYQIPCSYGKSYINQTYRPIQTCLKEHIADMVHNKISKSVIDEHSHNKHLICMDQTEIDASKLNKS